MFSSLEGSPEVADLVNNFLHFMMVNVRNKLNFEYTFRATNMLRVSPKNHFFTINITPSIRCYT